MKRIIFGLALLVGSAGAQVSNPSIVSVATAPSGSCSSGLPNQQVITTGVQYSCQSGTWAALAGGGGSSVTFPTGVLYGNNSTAAPTVATPIQITAGNAALNIVPVEQFGAVADYSGPGGGTGTGTDNATAFQACINYVQTTLGAGQCLLKKGNYRIGSTILITKSGVGFAGSAYGAGSTANSNQLIANAPLSAIYIDSATADAIDVNVSGSLSVPVSFNKFNDFTIMRTQAASASGTGCPLGPAGLSIQFAGGFVVDRVWSEDSACNFYFQNAGAYGMGYVSNSGSMWKANGFSPTITVAGFYLNGANSAESFRLRDSFSQMVYPGFSGVTSYGFIAKGASINDLMLRGFESSFQTYGMYIQYTGTGQSVQAGDIHIIDAINDTDYAAGIYLTGLLAASGGNVEVKGGWDSSANSGAIGVDIESSSGVTVSNVLSDCNGANNSIGIKAASSSRLALNNNNIFRCAAAAIQLGTVSDSTITGNTLSSISTEPTTTFIAATGLTYSSIMSNTIGGYATTGLSIDSTSSNNKYMNSIDPTNITTSVADAGVSDFSPQASWPPSGAGPVFSPVAGAISTGTTVTATCANGSPFVSTGTTAVAGATGIAISASGSLYGSCQGSGYFTTGSAYYTIASALPTAIHRWPMNEGSGSTLHDTIGTTNLTGTNITWAIATGLGSTATAHFDGTSSFASAASVDSTLNFNGTQPMTVAYWIFPTNNNSGTVIGNLDVSNSFHGWESGYSGTSPNGKPVYLVVGTVTTNQMTATGGTALALSAQCIVDTYSGSLNLAGTKIYVNGTTQSLTDTAGTLTSGSTSTSPVHVGARNNSTNLIAGNLAYVYVWNQVLTPAQAAQFCSAGPS
jgi:hypothetical protein